MLGFGLPDERGDPKQGGGIPVDIEFDPAKSRKNALERRLPFELVTALDWREARTFVDDRRDYGEVRYVASAILNLGIYEGSGGGA